MKEIIKSIVFKFAGKPLFLVIRKFYKPHSRMAMRLRFTGKFNVPLVDGKSFYLYNQAFFLESLIFWIGMEKLPWEYMSRRIWAHLCKSSSTIFDIGANTGVYALLAKVYNPGARVVAFEPQPNIYRIFKKNNTINNFDIKGENIALSDKNGKMLFYNYGNSPFSRENTTEGSLNKDWRPDQQSSIIVNAQRLDDYINEKSIKAIDLMKLDVETLEYEVLKGYGNYLLEHKPIIILEIQNREIGIKVQSLLDRSIYSCFNINEKNGLKSIMNLGLSEDNRNYLLCPQSRLNSLNSFFSPGSD